MAENNNNLNQNPTQPPINPNTNLPYTPGELLAKKYIQAATPSSPWDTFGHNRQTESISPRQDNFTDYGFTYQVGYDNIDRRAENQTASEQLLNGAAKFIGKTATAFAGGTVGTLYGIGSSIYNGELSSFYDNDFQRLMDSANESMDETLPNYVSKEQQDYSLLRQLGTANFWANDMLGGASFTAGAILSEMATAGLASELMVAKTAKFLKESSKVSDVVSDIAKSGNTWSKIKSVAPTFSRQLITGAGYEAGVEARHFKDEALNRLIEEHRERTGQDPDVATMLKFQDDVNTAANGVFAANFALVSASNFATLPKTFNMGLNRAAGKLDDGIIKATKDLTESELSVATKNLGRDITEPYINAFNTLTKGEKIGKGILGALKSPFMEGIVEEGGQSVISKAAENYVSNKYDPDANLSTKSFASALGHAFSETYGSKEGWKEIMIGAMIGGMSNVFEGGLSATKKKNENVDKIVSWMNANPDVAKTMKEAWVSAVQQQKASGKMDTAVALGDMFEAKNGEHDSFFSYVASRHASGFFDSIKEEVVDGIKKLSDEEFKTEWLGDENITKEEVAKRKQEIIDSTIKKANAIKNSLDLVENSVHFKKYNNDVRLGAAYSLASVDNLDNRELALKDELIKLTGGDENLAFNLNNKIGLAKISNLMENKKVREYIKVREEIEKLGALYSETDKEGLDKEIQAAQKELEKKIKESELDSSTLEKGYDYHKSVKEFNKAAKAWVEQNEKSPNKEKFVQGVVDLERLQDKRSNLINEYNRLLTREGAEKFEKNINAKKQENLIKFGILNKDGSPKLDQEGITNLMFLEKASSMEELQQMKYGVKAAEIQGLKTAITQEDITQAKTGDVDVDNFINKNKIIISELPKISDTMSDIEKSGVYAKRIKNLKQIIDELNQLIKDNSGTIKGEKFETLLDGYQELLDNELNNKKIVDDRLAKSNVAGKVISFSKNLNQVFTDFNWENKEQILNEISFLSEEEFKELVKTIEIKVEDYPNATLIDTKNPNVKIQTGGKNKKMYVVTAVVNGNRVIIGGLTDPRSFIVKGKPLDVNNKDHIKEINSDWVLNGEFTDNGEMFSSWVGEMIKFFETSIDTTNIGDIIPFENISKMFFINNEQDYNNLKKEERKDLKTLPKESQINLNGRKGFVLVERTTGGDTFYFKENDQEEFTELTAENNGADIISIKEMLDKMDSSKDKIKDRFRVLVNTVNGNRFIPCSYPDISSEVLMDNLTNALNQYNEKVNNGEEVGFIDIVGGKNSGYFLTSENFGISIRLSLSGSGGTDEFLKGKLVIEIQQGTKQKKFYLDGRSKREIAIVDGVLQYRFNNKSNWQKLKNANHLIEEINSFLDTRNVEPEKGKPTIPLKDYFELEGPVKINKVKERAEDDRNKLLVNTEIRNNLTFSPRHAKKSEPKKKDKNIKTEYSGLSTIAIVQKFKENLEEIASNYTEKELEEQLSLELNKVELALKESPALSRKIAEAAIEEAIKSKFADKPINLEVKPTVPEVSTTTTTSTVKTNEEINEVLGDLISQLEAIDSIIDEMESNGSNRTEIDRYTKLQKQKIKLEEEISKAKNSKDDSPFSIKDSKGDELVSEQEMVNTLKRILPIRDTDNPNGLISIQELGVLVKNMKIKGVPYGAFKANTIYLADKAAKGTEYHEAFHAVFRMFLTDAQIEQYLKISEKEFGKPTVEQLNELKSKSANYRKLSKGQLTNLWYEEKLADRFQNYSNNRNAVESNNILKRLWRKLTNWINSLKDPNPELDLLFNDIYEGKYKTAEIKYNIYARNVGIPSTAFSMLAKNEAGGIINKDKSERIINTISLKVAKKLFTNPSLKIEDITNDEIENLINYYDHTNWLNELSKTDNAKFSKVIKELETIKYALELSDNKDLIKKEVKKRIALFNINEEESLQDSLTDNESAERTFDISANEIGGIGSISKELRQYIAFTEVGIDEFGFGLSIEELENDKYKLAGNAYQIYEGITRVLADTPIQKMLPKLKMYVEYNNQANAFYKKLVGDIMKQIEGPDAKYTDYNPDKHTYAVLKDSMLFNKFIVGFNKVKYNEDTILFDPKTSLYRKFKANTADIDKVQFDAWFAGHEAKGFSPDIRIDELKSIIDTIERVAVLSDTIFDGKLLDNKNAGLNDQISITIKKFEDIGIALSPGYIKYSILKIKENKIKEEIEKSTGDRQKLFKDYLEYLDSYDNIEIINIGEDGILTAFKNALNEKTGKKSLFVEEKINNEYVGGAIGRLKKLAASNAIFDERVAPSTYQNAEGKNKYDKVLPSFFITEINNWNSDTRKQILNLVRDENITDEEAIKALMDIYIKSDNELEEYQAVYFWQVFKNNPLLRLVDENIAEKMLSNLKVTGIDGIREDNLATDEEGEISSVFGSSTKEGMSYGSLDARGKALTDLILFNADKNQQMKIGKNKINTAKIRVATNEAKNTTYTVELPINGGSVSPFYTNGRLSAEGIRWITSFFKQEYERIQLINKEINEGRDRNIIKDIHNGAKKGLKFYNFTKLNPDLLASAEKSALDGIAFNEFLKNNDLNSAFNEFINMQIDSYLKALSSPDISLIKETPEELESVLLPKGYYTEIKDEKTERTIKQIDRQAIGHFFTNDYFLSWGLNQLVHGDLAITHKAFEVDSADPVKRNASNVASGPGLGYGKSKMAIVKSNKENNPYGGKSIDTTDGQTHNTLDWYVETYLKSQGKFPPSVAEIYKKIQRGRELTAKEISVLRNFNADIRPRKIVGVDAFLYLKISSNTLTRGLTSYTLLSDKDIDVLYDKLDSLKNEYKKNPSIQLEEAIIKQQRIINNMWEALPGKEKLHSLLNEMELNNIGLVAHDSGVKKAIIDLGEYKDGNWNLIPHEIKNSHIREQVKTDSTKTEIIDGTQKMNLIWSEQDLNKTITFNNKDIPLKDVVDAYHETLQDRVKKGFIAMRKTLFDLREKDGTMEIGSKNYKILLESFRKSLNESSSDPYLAELLESEGNNPKYNLNFQAILTKVENMYLAYVSKQTIKQKAPGHKFTLISEDGYNLMEYNGNIVTVEEFKRNPNKYNKSKLTTRRLNHNLLDSNAGQYYSECVIPKQFAEMFNLKKGDVIPTELLEMMGIRIPTQDKHSMVNLKVVDFLPAEYGTGIMLPYEVIALSGADFDIDSIYSRINSFYVSNGKLIPYNSYLNLTGEEALKKAWEEYFNDSYKLDKNVAKRSKELISKNNLINQLKDVISTLKQRQSDILKEYSGAQKELVDDYNNLLIEAERLNWYFDEDGNYVQYDNIYGEDSGRQLDLLKEAELNKILHKLTFSTKKNDVELNNINKVLTETIKNISNEIREIKEAVLKENKYASNLQEFKDKYGDIVEANIIANSKSEIKNIKPITPSQTNNHLLKLERYLSVNKHLLEGNKIAETPASLDSLHKIVDEYYKNVDGLNLINPDNSIGIYSPLDKLMSAKANDTGKEGIGPAAVFNVVFQRLVNAGITLNVVENDKGKIIKDWTINIGGTNYNGFTSYLSKDGNRINDTISTILSAMTDNAKERFAAKLNLSTATLGPVLTMVGLGVPLDTAIAIVNQPIIREYAAFIALKKSPIQKDTERKTPKNNIIKELTEKYSTKGIIQGVERLPLKPDTSLSSLKNNMIVDNIDEKSAVYEALGFRVPNITVLPNGNLKIVAFRTEKVGPTSKGEYQRGKGLYLSLDKPYPGEDVYTVELEISPKNLLDRKLGFGEISEDYFIDEKNKRVDRQLDTLHEFKQSLGIKAEIGSIDGALMNELVLFDKELIDKALASKQVYNPQQKQQAQQQEKLQQFGINQIEVLNIFTKAEEISTYTAAISNILSLSKGFDSTFAEVEGIDIALNTLGIEVNKKDNTLGDNYSDYNIKNSNKYSPLSTPFNVVSILNQGLPKINLITKEMMHKDAGNFFILESKKGKELLNLTKNIINDRAINWDDTHKTLRRNLIAFLGTKAYRHKKNKVLKIKDLFENSFESDLIELRNKFPDNRLLSYLTYYKSKNSIKYGILEGLIFNNIQSNTRVKNNPDFQRTLNDSFTELLKSNDVLAREFSIKLFDFVMMKDQMLFRNNSLVRLIEPIHLKNISAGLDSVQELFTGNTNLKFQDVFGVSENVLMKEFIELFGRDTNNSYWLNSNSLTNINKAVAKLMKDRTNKEKGWEDSDYEKNSPLYLNNRSNPTKINFNLFKGIDNSTKEKDIEDNKSVLYSSALFPTIINEKGLEEFSFPYIISVKVGESTKLFKLTKYRKYKENNFIEGNLFEKNKNVFTGVEAEYDIVEGIGSTSILPYAFSVEEWEQFGYNKPVTKKTSKLEQLQSEKESTGTSLFDRLKAQASKTKEAEKPEETKGIPKQILDLFPEDLRRRMREEQKESNESSVDIANATAILNKLSSKFGIRWEFNTSIPGLGQFKNGVVLINPNKFKRDTLFHEFAHPFISVIKKRNPLLYENLVRQIQFESSILNKVKRLYPELSSEDQLEEAIVEAIGKYASEVNKESSNFKNSSPKLWNAIKTFLRRVSEFINELLGDTSRIILTSEIPVDTTLRELGIMMNLENEINLTTLAKYDSISENEINEFIKKCQ
jgi:hypothetical protein